MTGLGSSCGACKFLRRKCTRECVFAPYFCYEQAATHFAAVHKVFGASNVSKLLSHLPLNNRSEAAATISYEALARMNDPIYGCVAHIFVLQQQVASLQEEIEVLSAQITNVAPNFGSHGGFQANNNNNPYNGSQCNSSQDDFMDVQSYLNQQAQLLPHMGTTMNSVLHEAFNSQLNVQHPPAYGWEEQTFHFESEQNLSEGLLFDGVDQEVPVLYPWIDSGNNYEN